MTMTVIILGGPVLRSFTVVNREDLEQGLIVQN